MFLSLSWCPKYSATSKADGGQEQETISYLKGLSIEQLLQTEITSVSKKSEHFFNAAAAVTVINQEDLQRSGARTIPDALRLVPGLQVAQIDGSRWAIGARGFNDYYENKLLVLIDGRSVYTPLFSGVYWNGQDTVIEDIERIEVIRGPGATIWGANAVNGVINIITKSSANTQGGFISTVIGSHEQPLVSSRYGSKFGDTSFYRLYVKGFNREEYDNVSGGSAYDGWRSLRAGFRVDHLRSDSDTFSLQGEVYDGEADATSSLTSFHIPSLNMLQQGTETYSGGHLLLNWQHSFAANSAADVQVYFDHTTRDQSVAEEQRETFDFEMKHHLDPAGIHDIVWGTGYRWTTDDIDGTFSVSFDPESRGTHLANAFFQDDITLSKDTAWLTLGSKFEYNDYSGIEIQPSVRFRLQPTPKQMLWSAVSRAVRTPSRSDQDLETNLVTLITADGTRANIQLRGNDDFKSESLLAYELGYRWQAKDSLSFDLTTYYNDYDNLRDEESGPPRIDFSSGQPLLIMPQTFENSLEGEAYGFEMQVSWQATRQLKIFAAYTFLEFDLQEKDSVGIGGNITEELLSPPHQFQLRSYLDLSHDFSVNSDVYYVSELEEAGIDAYFRFDSQLNWQLMDNLQLSIGVDNIFDSGHLEFLDRSFIIASEIPRQYWLKLTYSF